MSHKGVNHREFYTTLEHSLATSNGADRTKWAAFIVERDVDMQMLSRLLQSDKKTGIRFTWLLSDIGIANPTTLKNALPFLFQQIENVTQFDFKQSFASYWYLVGIPEEQEAIAIDLLFGWLLSNDHNVTTKSRALKALMVIIEKYPELKNELVVCLKDQMEKHSASFNKLAQRCLQKIT